MKYRVMLQSLLGVATTLCLAVPATAQVCAAPPANLVSWYRGEGNGNDAGPASNNALANGVVTYAAAKVGNGFALTGTGFMQAPAVAAINLSSAITLAAWITPTSLGGRVVDKIAVAGTDGWLLDTYGGVVRLIVDGAAVSGVTPIPTGTASFIAGTYDGATLRVYLNGVLDNSLSIAPTAIPTNAWPLRIGADQNGANQFNGLIDEVDIYSRALAQSELQAIVAAGAAGKCLVVAGATQPIPALSPAMLGLLAAVMGAIGLFGTRCRPNS